MLQQGSVVKSVSGRDKGRFYLALCVEGGYVSIADGKVRSIANPKKKSLKHIEVTNTVLDTCTITSDKCLKKMLSSWNNEVTASEEVI